MLSSARIQSILSGQYPSALFYVYIPKIFQIFHADNENFAQLAISNFKTSYFRNSSVKILV